jgi:hypothetical protein
MRVAAMAAAVLNASALRALGFSDRLVQCPENPCMSAASSSYHY